MRCVRKVQDTMGSGIFYPWVGEVTGLWVIVNIRKTSNEWIDPGPLKNYQKELEPIINKAISNNDTPESTKYIIGKVLYIAK